MIKKISSSAIVNVRLKGSNDIKNNKARLLSFMTNHFPIILNVTRFGGPCVD